jgi:hypothetical protein
MAGIETCFYQPRKWLGACLKIESGKEKNEQESKTACLIQPLFRPVPVPAFRASFPLAAVLRLIAFINSATSAPCKPL